MGLIGHGAVQAGAAAIGLALDAARVAGTEIAIVDGISDRHLIELGAAVADFPLVTGGSGIALGLAPGPSSERPEAGFTPSTGPRVILSGSCSERTRAQIATAIDGAIAVYRIDPADIHTDDVLAWARTRLATTPILIYSSADPSSVAQARAAAPDVDIAHELEQALVRIGRDLVAAGAGALIVAGGETSGAVLQALGVERLAIGPQIAPGVPWTRSLDHPDLVIAAKSGNFGSEDFFLTAWEKLDG